MARAARIDEVVHGLQVVYRLRDAAGRLEQVFVAVDQVDKTQIRGRLWSQITVVSGHREGQTLPLNWRRIALGGLAAGLVINISGICLAHFVLGQDYVEAFQAKLAPQSAGAMAAKHVGLRLWFGLLAVFLYAAMRPRFGAGPRTAVLAGVTVFLSASLVGIVAVQDLGLLSGAELWVTVVWTLAEAIVATLVGASLYREPGQAPRGASRH